MLQESFLQPSTKPSCMLESSISSAYKAALVKPSPAQHPVIRAARAISPAAFCLRPASSPCPPEALGPPEPHVMLPPAWADEYCATWRAQGLVVQRRSSQARFSSCTRLLHLREQLRGGFLCVPGLDGLADGDHGRCASGFNPAANQISVNYSLRLCMWDHVSDLCICEAHMRTKPQPLYHADL